MSFFDYVNGAADIHILNWTMFGINILREVLSDTFYVFGVIGIGRFLKWW